MLLLPYQDVLFRVGQYLPTQFELYFHLISQIYVVLRKRFLKGKAPAQKSTI